MNTSESLQYRTIRLALPDASELLDQDAEFCVVEQNGGWQEIRFHDYAKIYSIPGLYEKLFYGLMRCNSHRVVARALSNELTRLGRSATSLRVLDLGAGNGMVGEELARLGASKLVGADILREAKLAAERDRPGVYDDYVVGDFTALDESLRSRLQREQFNCLTCVAALGFDDVSTRAFNEAVSLLMPGGIIAFNIKEEFLSPLDGSGFGGLLRDLVGARLVRPLRQRRYRHRFATNGEPLHYVLVIAEKVVPGALS